MDIQKIGFEQFLLKCQGEEITHTAPYNSPEELREAYGDQKLYAFFNIEEMVFSHKRSMIVLRRGIKETVPHYVEPDWQKKLRTALREKETSSAWEFKGWLEKVLEELPTTPSKCQGIEKILRDAKPQFVKNKLWGT